MRTEIIIAVVGAVPALVTAVVSVVLNNRILALKMDTLQRDFAKLEEKVTEHNNAVARIAVLEQKDEAQWRWIDDLKEKL